MVFWVVGVGVILCWFGVVEVVNILYKLFLVDRKKFLYMFLLRFVVRGIWCSKLKWFLNLLVFVGSLLMYLEVLEW